jgi:hypothetical protein
MLTFNISYWNLIKFLYFADTTERGDRGWKPTQLEGTARVTLPITLMCLDYLDKHCFQVNPFIVKHSVLIYNFVKWLRVLNMLESLWELQCEVAGAWSCFLKDMEFWWNYNVTSNWTKVAMIKTVKRNVMCHLWSLLLENNNIFLLISMLHELKRKHQNTNYFIVWIKI